MSQKSITHLFGEMDLNMDLSFDEIYKKAFDICESCGYMIDQYEKKKIKLFGCDNEIVVISFDENQKVEKIQRAQYSDDKEIIKAWHEVKKGSYVSIYESC